MYWRTSSWRRAARTEWDRVVGLEGRESEAYIDLIAPRPKSLTEARGMSLGVAGDRIAVIRPPYFAGGPRVTMYPRAQITFERVNDRTVMINPLGRYKAFAADELATFLAKIR